MKTLDKKEWVAVVVAVLVVGFFFIFGQTLISFFNNNSKTSMTQTPQVSMQDTLVGGGEMALPGNKVFVHYTGRFVDGRVFDSSLTRNEPISFVLGSGQVIKGWDEGLVGMRVGGKRILSIPPELGYGMYDYQTIPGGSTLIFEVELVKVEK
ncbi:MAG: FKBP-type peptidyl-prolyl cis-trans isomerase [Nitrospira sp.]